MYDGVKIFLATMHRDREVLGERVTEWLRSTSVEVVDYAVRQTSDVAYHCLSIVIFYKEAS